MPDFFNDDFRDFLKALNEEDVEYIDVGGMAVIIHGYIRTTGASRRLQLLMPFIIILKLHMAECL